MRFIIISAFFAFFFLFLLLSNNICRQQEFFKMTDNSENVQPSHQTMRNLANIWHALLQIA